MSTESLLWDSNYYTKCMSSQYLISSWQYYHYSMYVSTVVLHLFILDTLVPSLWSLSLSQTGLCAAGFEEDVGDTCVACTAGYNKSYTGAGQCELCTQGRFSTSASSTCTLCPAGNSSPLDVFSYIDQHDALALFHLGVWHNTNIGTYGSTLGLNTPLCTGECPAGYYCESGSIDATETPCPVCCSMLFAFTSFQFHLSQIWSVIIIMIIYWSSLYIRQPTFIWIGRSIWWQSRIRYIIVFRWMCCWLLLSIWI